MISSRGMQHEHNDTFRLSLPRPREHPTPVCVQVLEQNSLNSNTQHAHSTTPACGTHRTFRGKLHIQAKVVVQYPLRSAHDALN
jgi:hypothetical protein